MWIEPKLDWVSTDKFNYSDYNRIKNNIAYLREEALKLYVSFPFSDMGEDKTSYEDIPYADEFMKLEENLEYIKNYTFPFYDTDRGYWYDNQPTPNYNDFNRLENACLEIRDGLIQQEKCIPRLSFTLGMEQSTIKC